MYEFLYRVQRKRLYFIPSLP